MKKKFITLRYNEHKKIFYRYQKLGAEKKISTLKYDEHK